MWELDYKEDWMLKKWCFWTVVLEKTLEGPLNCKEIKAVSPKENQSWIFMLKLQYFGHLMWRTDSLEKTLILGKIEGRRRRERQRMRWLDGILDSMDMSLSSRPTLLLRGVGHRGSHPPTPLIGGVGRQSSYLQSVTSNYRYLQPKKGKLFPAEALPSRCGRYSDTALTVEPREPEGVPKKHLVWCVVATRG